MTVSRLEFQEFLAEAAAKTGVTVERIVAELAKIAFSDVRNALDWGMKETEQGSIQYVTLKDSKDVDDDTAAVVAEVAGPAGPQAGPGA